MSSCQNKSQFEDYRVIGLEKLSSGELVIFNKETSESITQRIRKSKSINGPIKGPADNFIMVSKKDTILIKLYYGNKYFKYEDTFFQLGD